MSEPRTNEPSSRLASAEFSGMPPEGLELLERLSDDNRRGWMARHRASIHRHLRDPFLAYLRATSVKLAAAGHSLAADETTVFKMQRDVRFSTDKRPYHEHLEAVFSSDGRRIGSRAAIHVRFGPGGGFLRAGSFLQPPESVRALRESMRARRERFVEIARALAAKGHGLRASQSLKRLPRGFEDVEDSELAGWLRMIGPVAERRLTPGEWASGAAMDSTVQFADACRAWLLFQREALQDIEETLAKRPPRSPSAPSVSSIPAEQEPL